MVVRGSLERIRVRIPHALWRTDTSLAHVIAYIVKTARNLINSHMGNLLLFTSVDENVPYMRDVMNCEFPFKLCQGFCHVGMMSKRSEMMSCHYRIETHVSRTPAAFGLALIPAGATQAASQVGNAVWSGSRMNLRNSLSNPLSVMHAV